MKTAVFVRLTLLIVSVLTVGPFPEISNAATLLVYNNNDLGAGSLRQAIADNAALGGGNTIVFSNVVTGTIVLTASELIITSPVTIQGPGASILTLSGNNAHRVIGITNANVTLSGLTIAFGRTNFFPGAGILSVGGILTLNDCVLANNTLQSNGNGGGASVQGTLIATNCTFSANACNSSFMFPDNRGAGAYVAGGCTLVNCTFIQNSSQVYGGGLYLASGTATIVNCTFYNNSAPFSGGGLYISGIANLTSCTITRNTTAAPNGGGGIFNNGTCNIRNTIVARNTNSLGSGAWDCSGPFISGGFNLIGAINGSGGWGALGDQTGFTNSPLNPLLDIPGLNGGSILTVRPLPGSPAIDHGQSFGLLTDQRGRTRPIDQPSVPNAPGGDASEIGALEISPGTLLVSNTNDTGPGSLRQTIIGASPFDGDNIEFAPGVVGTIGLTSGSLAIDKDLTIRGPGARLVSLDGRTNSQIFLVLQGNVGISGLSLVNGREAGSAGNIEQDGFQARGGAIYNQATLVLNDCVLSNNTAIGGAGGPSAGGFAGTGGNGKGGAIANIGTLLMTNCNVISNYSLGGAGGVATAGGFDGIGGQANGGGIYSFGPITLVRCALAGNSALGGTGPGGDGSGSGGGLNIEGAATVLSSTVAGNLAGGTPFDFGGGIYDNGTGLLLRSCTIAGNQADYGGGLSTSATDMGNTILAGNFASSGGADCSGVINSSDYNLIQNTNGAGINGITLHNIIGQSPLLGLLQDNGGLSLTMALPVNSPAVDKGKSFGLFADQRNAQRPFNFASVPDAGGGDGSDIGAFELGRPPLTIAKIQSDIVLSWPSFYGSFQVEAVGDVAASNNWATVAGAPSVVGSQYVLTNGPVSGVKFYRLKSP